MGAAPDMQCSKCRSFPDFRTDSVGDVSRSVYIAQGIANEDSHIFPDPTALQIQHVWENDGRRVEDAIAAMLG
jgi:hypothetical protein